MIKIIVMRFYSSLSYMNKQLHKLCENRKDNRQAEIYHA